MGRNTPLTDTERQAIADAHAAGKSLNATARELGRSKAAVSAAAKAAGLTWGAANTARTAQATRSAQVTNAEKRATLEARLLDEAGLLLDQLHRPHTVFSFGGRDNTYAEHLLDEPDVGAKRAIVQAAGTAIDKAVKLADADRDTAGAKAGQSLVGGLFALLQATDPGDTPDD